MVYIMDADFYKKLIEKNQIEKNIGHLIFKVFTNDKITKNAIAFLICFILSNMAFGILNTYSNTLERFLNLLADSFSFSVGITSFLIAAVTIFFSLIKSETSYVFLLIHEEGNKECKLKTVIYNFIKPTMYFTFMIVYNFIFKITYQFFIDSGKSMYWILRYIAIYTFFHLLCASIIELFFLIYNIYSFVMMINLENVVKKQLESQGQTYEKYIEYMEKQEADSYNKEKNKK